MTFRSRDLEENLGASEDYSHCYPSGSFLFCNPSEVDHWNQSVPLGEISLPTPPDSISECATSDCQDMSTQAWNQASLSDEWTTVSAPEHSTLMQPSGIDWSNQRAPVAVQDFQAADTSAWLNANHGPVDIGLSPVLSQESQSSHNLHSFSEPDSCVLPPRLDLPFAAEPSWTQTGPVVYASPDGASQFSSAFGFTPSQDQGRLSMECSSSTPHGLYPGSQPPVFFPQGGQAAYPRRTVPYPVAPTPMRPLLPRTEGSGVAGQPTHGPQRTLRPQFQGSRSSQASVSSVSSPPGPQQGITQHHVAFGHASGPAAVAPRSSHNLPHGASSPYQAAVPVQPTSEFHTRPVPSMPFVSDPTAEDFSAFIQFDREDQATSPVASSYVPGYGLLPSMPAEFSGETKPIVYQPEQDVKAFYHAPNSASASLASDSDEGRHRSHMLYSEGPKPDGMYRCPWAITEPNCPHKPTKLKCNYDKYIDSHLKPFRCKVESCAKQEFSSTACLLRHEREAHGMHGHGDRPHLCLYPGCERGISGNGFPRRYNLYDHMRRVHDHNEEATSSISSPDLGSNIHGHKKTTGRKRKVSSPTPVEPVPHRQKTMPLRLQHPPAIPVPQVHNQQSPVFYQPMHGSEASRRSQHRQRVYSNWANQRDLIAKQMDFVQSPEDEAGLQSLTQNLEVFRRLSEQARRG